MNGTRPKDANDHLFNFEPAEVAKVTSKVDSKTRNEDSLYDFENDRKGSTVAESMINTGA